MEKKIYDSFSDMLNDIPSEKKMTTHKLLESETVIPDDGNMFPMYAYIIDGVFAQAHIFERMSVAEYKKQFNAKEVRRCELFGHPGAKIGDKVAPENSP